MTCNRLFVLQPQKLQNMKDHFSELGAAIFTGSVYRSKCGYPVLAIEGNQTVRGQLLELKLTDMQMMIVDELMGFNPQNPAQSLYHRVAITVSREGQPESVWCYVLNPRKQSSDFKLIESGCWETALSEHPPLTEKLTDKQKSYIKKLGTSSGRDVIPINLALYRELMNLELIVDKGRRLALSKFGQEVFSYLE